LMDSASLFDAITRQKRTSEGRLKIDMYAAREAYRRHDLDNIALIKSEFNLTDALTKVPGNSALLDALRTHRISHPVAQYVLAPNCLSPSLLRGAQ
jgi:hypothetical protein